MVPGGRYGSPCMQDPIDEVRRHAPLGVGSSVRWRSMRCLGGANVRSSFHMSSLPDEFCIYVFPLHLGSAARRSQHSDPVFMHLCHLRLPVPCRFLSSFPACRFLSSVPAERAHSFHAVPQWHPHWPHTHIGCPAAPRQPLACNMYGKIEAVSNPLRQLVAERTETQKSVEEQRPQGHDQHPTLPRRDEATAPIGKGGVGSSVW
jgi:hypothetical protein